VIDPLRRQGIQRDGGAESLRARGLRIRGLRDERARFGQGPGHDVGEGNEGLALDGPQPHGPPEGAPDHGDLVAGVEVPAGGGVQDGAGVDDADALHRGVEVGLDEGLEAEHEAVHGLVLGRGGHERGADHVGDVPLHVLDHRPEEVVLVPEVVVEGALGDAGPPGDLVDGGGREALLAEQVTGGADERPPGGLGLGGLGGGERRGDH
jgi:hypothetical protein